MTKSSNGFLLASRGIHGNDHYINVNKNSFSKLILRSSSISLFLLQSLTPAVSSPLKLLLLTAARTGQLLAIRGS